MLHRLIAKPLDLSFVSALIEKELQSILEVSKPILIYLFGSAATHKMSEASDLDILVVLDDQDELKAVKARYYCRKKNHDWPVDIIFMHETAFHAKSLIGGVPMMCLKDGRIIYRGPS